MFGHDFSFSESPGQAFPPQIGVGLSHFLVQVIDPSPHVVLHDPQVHELHPPSRGTDVRMQKAIIIFQ